MLTNRDRCDVINRIGNKHVRANCYRYHRSAQNNLLEELYVSVFRHIRLFLGRQGYLLPSKGLSPPYSLCFISLAFGESTNLQTSESIPAVIKNQPTQCLKCQKPCHGNSDRIRFNRIGSGGKFVA